MMRALPQEEHADLGLVENDLTPDMRKPPAATEGLQLKIRTTTMTKEVQP